MLSPFLQLQRIRHVSVSGAITLEFAAQLEASMRGERASDAVAEEEKERRRRAERADGGGGMQDVPPGVHLLVENLSTTVSGASNDLPHDHVLHSHFPLVCLTGFATSSQDTRHRIGNTAARFRTDAIVRSSAPCSRRGSLCFIHSESKSREPRYDWRERSEIMHVRVNTQTQRRHSLPRQLRARLGQQPCPACSYILPGDQDQYTSSSPLPDCGNDIDAILTLSGSPQQAEIESRSDETSARCNDTVLERRADALCWI
nr:hypothetical protein CFP56_34781 [Quercus suber]